MVLPGVGAFRDAIARLRETHLDSAITDHIHSGRPFLGICLGMQMLFTRDHEDGLHEGLGLFAGDVVRFPDVPGLKVPHMGWNTLDFPRPKCPLFAGLPPEPAVYFVHSYYPDPADRGRDRRDGGLSRSRSPPRSGGTTSSRRSSTRRRASRWDCKCCGTSRGCD